MSTFSVEPKTGNSIRPLRSISRFALSTTPIAFRPSSFFRRPSTTPALATPLMYARTTRVDVCSLTTNSSNASASLRMMRRMAATFFS